MLLRIVILVIYDGVVVIDHVDLNHACLPSYDLCRTGDNIHVVLVF